MSKSPLFLWDVTYTDISIFLHILGETLNCHFDSLISYLLRYQEIATVRTNALVEYPHKSFSIDLLLLCVSLFPSLSLPVCFSP